MTTEAPTKVLIVEDQPWDAELMSQQLVRAGLNCTTRQVDSEPNFREALDTFEPDVVLADYSLPRFSGTRALRVLQELRFDVPVVLVTGNVTEDVALEALQIGFADYVLKDNLLRLGSAVRAAVGNHRARLEGRAAQLRAEALARLVDESRSEIYIFSSDTFEFVYANRAAVTNLGYSPEELYTMTVLDIKPFDGDEFETLLEPLRTGRREVISFSTVHQRRDNTSYPVDVQLQRMSYLGEEVFLAMIWDTEDREILESDRALLEEAVHQSSNMVIITDPSGTIQYVNPSFERVTGYSADEVLGENPRILKSGQLPTDFYHDMWKELSAGRPWTRDFVNRRKDGSEYHQRTTIFGTYDADGSLRNYVASGQDVSSERALEEQLRQAQKMEAVGQLTGGIAHDFNNELAGIMINAQLLAMTLSPDGGEIPELTDIEAAARRGADLVNKLMGFSRDEPLDLEVLDPAEVVEDAVTLLKRLLPASIELKLRLDHGTRLVEGDRTALQQILLNLGTNARDAMPDGGVLEISSHVDDTVDGPTVQFVVRDSGVGMEPDVLGRIFDPFFTTKPRGRGTGLGLSTVFGLTRALGGGISVDSEPGMGTTFRLLLPASSEVADVSDQAGASVPVAEAGQETILVVDDEEPLLRAASRALRRFGYTVFTAENGHDALEAIRDHQGELDLVVSDVIMPGMLGTDVYALSQDIAPSIPFLFVSGYAPEENGLYEQLKAHQFLPKPWGIDQLATAVREAIDRDRRSPARNGERR